MIVQPYAFKSDDFDEVYAQAREFIERLRVDADVSVTLPDGFRSNTKYYPDYDRTMTVLEVFPDVTVDEQIPAIEGIYVGMKTRQDAAPEPENNVAEAYRLVRENGTRYVLDRNSEGYFLTDTSDHGTVFWGMDRDEVLPRVQRALGIQPTVTVSADDFDPFMPIDNDLP